MRHRWYDAAMSPPLLRRVLRAAGVAALLLVAAASTGAASPPPQDADSLRATVLDAALKDDARIKAARSLEEKDPEGLGTALLDLAKKKDPHNLSFLLDVALRSEGRHIRVAAVYAAWQCAPDTVVAAFVKAFAGEDDKIVMRAIEAAGLLAVPSKDKTVAAALVEQAAGETPLRAIEAARALSRIGDKRLQQDLVDLCARVKDNHVRKHLVWALQDQLGPRAAEKRLTPLKGRPGEEGRNAVEAIEIVKDAEEEPFTWDPMALKSVPDWWAGRSKGLVPDIAIGDPDTKERVQSWFDHLQKIGPTWRHLAASTFSKVVLRPANEDRVVDAKTRSLFLGASEILLCESAWQGSYVMARDACLGLAAGLGEPVRGHRGWEPAYVEIHTFFATDGEHRPGPLAEFVANQVAKKGWR